MKTENEALIERHLIEAKKRGLERLADRVARHTVDAIAAYLRHRASRVPGLESRDLRCQLIAQVTALALEDAATAIERGAHWVHANEPNQD